MSKLVPAFCAIVVAGCASSDFTYGRAFPSENITKVVKGKTTAAEVLQLFGEPMSKYVVSEHEEKWTYSHGSGTVQVSGFQPQTQSRQKTLDVLLKDGVVTNYSFLEGPGPTSTVQ